MPKTLVAATLIPALLALSSYAQERNESQARIVPLQSLAKDFEVMTVLQGTFFFAVSDKYDPSLLKGPFHIHWRDGLKSMDHANADKVFRFRKGDVVTTPRGIGTIRQGYASGSIIQYEIEGPDRTPFMVDDAKTNSPARLDR